MTAAKRPTKRRTAPVHKEGFGARIRNARKKAGFSQKRLLDELGWPNDSNSRLSGYETEARQPSLADFKRIAVLCKVNPAYLAFGDYQMKQWEAELITGYLTAEDRLKNIVDATLRLTSRNNEKRSNE